MHILNFGSLNIDGVCQVERFVREGKAILAGEYVSNIEGRGLNQSTTLARAGAHVVHTGAIGPDGTKLKIAPEADGVNAGYIVQVPEASSHAVIQVANGENSIVVYGGTNRTINHACVCKALDELGPDDLLLAQNEVSCVPYIMKQAKARGMKVAIDASPIITEFLEYPLELADYIIVNEQEGGALADGSGASYEEILSSVAGKYRTVVLLTARDKGTYYRSGETQYYQPIIKVDTVDTTGAGGAFYGYFLAGLGERMESREILKMTAAAAAITVSRPGASKGIPWRTEIIIWSSPY